MTKLLDKHYFEYCGNKMTPWLLTLRIKSFLRYLTITAWHKTIAVFGNITIDLVILIIKANDIHCFSSLF